MLGKVAHGLFWGEVLVAEEVARPHYVGGNLAVIDALDLAKMRAQNPEMRELGEKIEGHPTQSAPITQAPLADG